MGKQVWDASDTAKAWTLSDIVEQLASCGFTCEAGKLEMNEAFIALNELAFREWAEGISSNTKGD